MDQETLEYATKIAAKVVSDYMVANQANAETPEFKTVVRVSYKILEELRKPLGEIIRAKNAKAPKVTEEVVAESVDVEVVAEEKPKKTRKKKEAVVEEDEF